MSKKPILVAGGGGFIGGHLVARLLNDGYQVRSVDVKPLDEWYQVFPEAENVIGDLKHIDACHKACDGVSDVYCLAADMGGMGFIENNKALCMLSVLINTHLLQAALAAKVDRYFYASSACVYVELGVFIAQPTFMRLRREDSRPTCSDGCDFHFDARAAQGVLFYVFCVGSEIFVL